MAQSSDPTKRPKPGPWPPAPDSNEPPAIPPSSWAKRTGFRPRFSGETNATDSSQITTPAANLEPGQVRPTPAVQPVNAQVQGQPVKKWGELPPKPGVNLQANSVGTVEGPAAAVQPSQRVVRNVVVENCLPQTVNAEFVSRHVHMKYELRDTPGLVPIGYDGFQHYLSMMGSLILIPLVIVPAMGGDHEDTSMVVSTVLFVSGMSTLLQANFGSSLPLIQGPSLLFLEPALAIINSPEFLGLNGYNFKHIMKELQGAIIIASAFQAFLGYSGLMTLLLRLINPVVVSPTVAAVGLSFYSYGFPQMGACLEIGIVQILLVITFSLYLRKISVLGHRVFLIYAVPFGLAITWAMSFLLTEAGAYKYDGCDVGSYHASSLLVASRPPTPGVVSRGIGLEGLCSILAGVWGTGCTKRSRIPIGVGKIYIEAWF